MNDFINKIIDDICSEEGIKYKNISNGFITILEKDGKCRFINKTHMGLNTQISELIADDKFAMYEILKHANIPVIEHILVWDRNNIKNKTQKEEKIELLKHYFHQKNNHIVLKPNRGLGGKMVFNIAEEDNIRPVVEELLDYTDSIIANPFYEAKNEHRIIMLNGKCRLAYTKALVEGQWQFNLSKGNKAIKLKEGNLKNNLVDLAQKAYNYIGINFASIDIFEGIDGELNILEINSGVATEKYTTQHPEDFELVKNIYADAIRLLFLKKNIEKQ